MKRAIPVREDVAAACELLGFDPLHVANEGRFIAIVPQAQSRTRLVRASHDESSAALRSSASVLGQMSAVSVSCRTAFGAMRAIDMLSGEQLPRIC